MSESLISKLIERLIEIDNKLKEVKPLYKEQDQIILTLVEAGLHNLSNGNRKIKIVDAFKGNNVAYKVSFFKKWEIEIE